MSAPVRLSLPSLPGLLRLARAHRLALLAAGGGVLLLGLAGRLLRRRRRAPPDALPLATSLRYVRPQQPRPAARQTGAGDGAGDSVSPGSTLRRRRRVSALSSAGSAASLATVVAAGQGPLQPQQLGMMGMEAMEAAVGYWEDALAAYSADVTDRAAVPSPEEAQFCRQLQHLLDAAGRLQAQCEQMFLFYESALYRSGVTTPAPPSAVSSRGRTRTATSDCSIDSFHSAEGVVADLSDFDDVSELSLAATGAPLYQAALRLYESDGIPFRTLRTQRCGCGSDVEYLARLHCVRLAYQYLVQQESARVWLVDAGRALLTLLMRRAGRHPKDIVTAYEAMVAYLARPDVWPTVKLELQARNVRCFTFFDIVLDYIILDAFDDLEAPPSTVVAVMQNRWLTASFKESALNTAIWSVLKAKRRAMQFANGFKSHFYSLAEHLIPVLAWGLLGPDQQLAACCEYLKDEVSDYVRDIFDPDKVQYTSVEDLTEDLYRLTQHRYSNVCQRLESELEDE